MNREQAKVVHKITELLRVAAAPWCINGHGRMKGVGRYFYCPICEPIDDNPWCVKCRKPAKAYGVTRNAIQRWMCKWCSTSFLGTRESKATRMGVYPDMVRKTDKLNQAIPLFQAGWSTRRVANAIGIAGQTALKFRRLALKDFAARCGCGEDAGHKGWCWWRYQNSPKRQAFMKRWRVS